MRTQSWLLPVALCGTAFGLPAPAPTSPNPLAAINNLLNGVLSNVGAEGQELAIAASALLTELDQVAPTATPTSIEDVASILKSATAASPTALINNVVELVLNGIRPDSLNGVLKQYSAEANNENNNNPKEPPTPIYPAAGSHDAPYSISEEKLRAAIYIPDTFTYGKKPPVVLVPGTATKGGLCYEANIAKLLPNEEYADPVWLNVPGWLLENVAWNSEFVAYAVNYISGITSRNVSVIALSQGNLDTQWALTYWPSIRPHVSDYVAISPDYHGSIILDALCPAIGLVSCAPAVWQQKYNANFIAHFRAAGGASAWVPTTTVYTGTDDVVQPQHGANASAFMQDERNVGVLNVELQLNCPLLSPALVGTHESLLWGAPLQALIKDALTHDGPANIDRIGKSDWNVACSKIVADGLNLADVVGTEVAVPIAFAAMFLYPNRSFKEPGLPAYAS